MIVSVFPSNFIDMVLSQTHSHPIRLVPLVFSLYREESKSSVSPDVKSTSLSTILQGKTP